MRRAAIQKLRWSSVMAAGLVGALTAAGCGSDGPPGGKTGEGLGSAGGTTGTGHGGSVAIGSGGSAQGGSSATGSGASGGTINVAGTSSGSAATGGDGGSLDEDAACVAETRDSEKAVVALLFMVDISGSMNCPVPELDPPCEVDPNRRYDETRWTEMGPALKDFFDSSESAGMWAGISFFSRHNGSCDVRDYEMPDAEIGLLPDSATALDMAVDKQRPSGMTPTVPSLQGALNHAGDWAEAHADQEVVVVYATDGYPKGCDHSTPANTIDNAADIAATAYAGPNRIRTYVLGVGPNLDDLNAIAESGGTHQAFQIDTGKDVTAQLTAAFDEIRSAVAVDCAYTVPEAPAGQDFSGQVNVNYTSGSGAVTEIPYNDAADCEEGWQYSDDMKQIVICGSTCDTVKADPDASIQVLYGCKDTVRVGDPR